MFFKLFIAFALAALTGIATANPIVSRDVDPIPIPTPYCCINNCRICDWQECWGDPRECADTFFPGCCAMMFPGKRDEDGALEAYNMKGELVQFVSPAPGLKAKKDEDGDKQYHNKEVELVEVVDIAPQESAEVVESIVAKDLDIAPQESVEVVAKDVDWGTGPPSYAEQYCCSNQCRSCSIACPDGFPDCTSPEFRYCCALWVYRKRDDGAKEYYNQQGELVEFITSAN